MVLLNSSTNVDTNIYHIKSKYKSNNHRITKIHDSMIINVVDTDFKWDVSKFDIPDCDTLLYAELLSSKIRNAVINKIS